LASRSIARYPFLELHEHDVLDEGAAEPRLAVTIALKDWCVVAAITNEGELVLVEQHRHGVDALTLEPAGGIIDDGEPPAAAALRELLEETGYSADSAELLLTVHPNPALSDNRAFLFLARDARKIADPEERADERTRVVLLDRAKAADTLRTGGITHALAVLTLLLALERA